MNVNFDEALQDRVLPTGSLQRKTYVASNRFQVRKGKDAKFDQRWANRKSRLAQLDGFRFFTLLKRVDAFGAKYESEADNYVSYTIWQTKDNFNEWRTGEAFKEAHGGGGILDFMRLISTALFIIKGSPKPAFFDGIAQGTNGVAVKRLMEELEVSGGWRTVVADGEREVSADVFVASRKFTVNEIDRVAFETSMGAAINTSTSNDVLFCNLLRRDADKSDDGFNYSLLVFFSDRGAFESFRKSDSYVSLFSSNSGSSSTDVFYDGKLALFSSDMLAST